MSPQIDPFHVSTTAIDGLLQLTPKSVTDERGTVRELFRASAFGEAAVDVPDRWQQVNLTWTRTGALRGLHGEATDKLIGVVVGSAFSAWVDARPDSPTRGVVVTLELVPGVQVFVPAGVCNGFQATSEPGCEYFYLFGAEWRPDIAGTMVNPLDPALGIAWPLPVDPADPAVISAKDAAAPPFAASPDPA